MQYLSDEFHGNSTGMEKNIFEVVRLIWTFACLGGWKMTLEEVAGFGALPFPLTAHILCIDLERLLNVSTHFFGWRPSLGSHALFQKAEMMGYYI